MRKCPEQRAGAGSERGNAAVLRELRRQDSARGYVLYRLRPEDVRNRERVFRNTGYTLINTEISMDTVAEACILTHQHGGQTIVKPSSCGHIPEKVLRDIDILVPNQSELEEIAPTGETLSEKADYFRLYGKGQYKPTPSGIGAKVRHVWNFTKGKLAMVAIDYIQNHRPDGKAFGRTDEIERFMGELSEELEEFPVGQLLLSQLNRDKERGNRANTVADLKGSSSIEQEADYIAFLQKDTKKSFGCYEVDFYAVKTRSGTPRWSEKLEFNSSTGKFIEVASRYSSADCPGND